MAQPKVFRFHLRYYDGAAYQYYYVDAGSVLTTTTQTQLSHSPQGWRDCEIGYERGFTYYGVFTNYTTPLKFVKDGALILRHLAYTTGIESKAELYVEKFNTTTGVYGYEPYFFGDLDMSQIVDEFDFVTANIMENGFPAKLKANESTPYEYDIDGNPDVQYVYNDGVDLQAKSLWTGAPVGMSPLPAISSYYPYLSNYDLEGTNLTLNLGDQDGTNYSVIENNQSTSQDIELNCDYNINIFVDGSVAYNSYLRFEYREYTISTGIFTGTTYAIENSSTPQVPGTSQTYLGSVSHNITLGAGKGLSVTVRMEVTFVPGYVGTASFSATTIGLEQSAYWVNRYEPSYIPCLYVMDVLSYLIASIGSANDGTADPYLSVDSTLLQTTYENQLVITSGDGLRNLTGSKLKITFADLFKFLDSKFGVCFYYESSSNTCYLEKKDSVFVNAVSTTYPLIASCNKMRVTPFISETFNNLKIGSGTFTYDQKGDGINEVTNGKDEFNNTTEWNTPIVRVKKTADYVSPIRCDMYGIEFTRINLTNKTISDSSSDNDIFAMHIDADNSATYTIPATNVTINYHLLHRDPIVVGTWEIFNIFATETAYNILFSPKRSIIRNGTYFRSLLKLNDNDYINFQISGKNNAGNTKMYTQTLGVTDYDEWANILVSDLCANDAVLFQPVILEFETLEQISLYTLIGGDKYRYIEVVHLGNSYYGFIISVTSKPANRGTTKFKLLATATTDLTQLVR